ncbi:AraC family transcriptional regulator [Natranaerovirga hydrolytica]|uniref:AraC family transcriptional regulator n=1 Tax=Natranaerovirga hydrolytica TaxID=680378 RepID=A0A4R1N0Y0_9FIRM|nr:AraC family transcriptional regulator [Natranaerovirga hydrolytica]TCK98590.1 AraC family transcriptional regulator [Natranaerovirga hydrolytica]
MKDKMNYIANTMVSDLYEIFYIEELVDEDKTLYHLHDFYEIHITLSGNGLFYLDGTMHELSAGTVLLIHSGDLHRIVAQKSSYFERMYIFVTPEFIENSSTKHTNLKNCFQPIGNVKSKILKTSIVELIDHLKHFMKPPNLKNYGEDLLYEQALVNFLLYLNKLVLNKESEITRDVSPQNELMDRVIKYVNNNLKEDLSLYAVASHFYISKYHLSHKFKEVTDITFHNYVLKKRLFYAKQLLRKHNNANLIYSDCGFKSYSYFLKAFKKEFGITPKEFMNLTKKGNKMYFNKHH